MITTHEYNTQHSNYTKLQSSTTSAQLRALNQQILQPDTVLMHGTHTGCQEKRVGYAMHTVKLWAGSPHAVWRWYALTVSACVQRLMAGSHNMPV
jgi:hypothetical protein